MSYRLEICLCLALAAAAAGVFWKTTGHGFIALDDGGYVTENAVVRQGLTSQGLRWAFTNYQHYYWSPVTFLSHMLDVELFGMRAGKHHRTNVILHSLNATLLFVLLRAATGSRWRSAAAAALFAVHPLRVESVAWVAERKDLLCGFFWLSTAIAWVRSRRCSVAVCALFVLGLMSKPMFVTLPFALVLLDYWPLGRVGLKPLVKDKMPLFVLSAAASAITVVGQMASASVASLTELSLPARLGNASWGAVLSLRDVVWPHSLGVMYPLLPGHPKPSQAIAAVLFLAAISAWAFSKRTPVPYVWMGWLWFLGTLAPVSGLFQAGSQARADRFTYLPGIGLGILIVWGGAALIARWTPRPHFGAAIAVLALSAFAARSWRQVEYWRDSATLFSHTLAVISDADETRLWSDGLPRAFIERYRGSLYWPTLFTAWLHLIGDDFAAVGGKAQALTAYSDSIRLNPEFARGLYARGALLSGMGRDTEAAADLGKALRVGLAANIAASAHLMLGVLRRGQVDEAIEEFRLALLLDSSLTEARKQLALALAGAGRTREAIEELERAVAERPDDQEAREQLKGLR